MPVNWCTYPDRETIPHTASACRKVVCKTIQVPCEKIVKSVHLQSRVWEEHQVSVETGDWHDESYQVPGPIETRCCRSPGDVGA